MIKSTENSKNFVNIVLVLGLKLKPNCELENDLIDRLELANRLFSNVLFDENATMNTSNSFLIMSGKGKYGVEAN